MLLVSNLAEGYSGFQFQCYSHPKDFGEHEKRLRPPRDGVMRCRFASNHAYQAISAYGNS